MISPAKGEKSLDLLHSTGGMGPRGEENKIQSHVKKHHRNSMIFSKVVFASLFPYTSTSNEPPWDVKSVSKFTTIFLIEESKKGNDSVVIDIPYGYF